MLVHASIDENGNAKGGKAGDSTGKEVSTRSWYAKGWTVMLRYKDASVAKKAADIAVKLAKSNLVGYDQSQRNTLYRQLKKNGFDVDKYIKSGVKTETDCSAFMYACYCCVVKDMRSDSNAPTTSTMCSFYKKHGFTAYRDSKYITSDKNLKKGDVLVKEGSHTVMNITDNAAAKSTTYYPKYTGTSVSIVDALKAVGEKDTSKDHRVKIAMVNNIPTTYSAAMNSKMLSILKTGKLIKA